MKTTKKFIAALLAVTLVFVLFSCDDAPHVHTFSEDWSKDETYHWHKATCEHTEEVSGKAEHTFGEWVEDKAATIKEEGTKHRICSVCNYKQEVTIPKLDHTCTASSTYGHDENKHWFKCTNPLCDKHLQEADHTFNIGSTSEDGKVTMSCVCGASKVVENAVLVADATSLKSAVAGDKTIIILKNDITLENTIDITKDITIDLNGKTISSTKRVFLVKAGILTLDNGTVKAEIEKDAGQSVIRVSAESVTSTETTDEKTEDSKETDKPSEDKKPDAGVVLKKDAKIIAPTSYGITAFGEKKANVSLDIYGTIESGNPCIGGQGAAKYNVCSVTMNVYDGAVLTATNDLTNLDNIDNVAVYQPNPGTLNIKGGTVTSKNGTAVEIRAGKAYITGGKLVSEASEYSAKANGNGPTVIGAAVAVSQHTTGQPIEVIIVGGTLEASTGKKLAVESLQGTSNNNEVEVVANKDVVDIESIEVGKTFKGALYVADKEAGEMYYEGDAEFLSLPLSYGYKVTLLSDITSSKTIEIKPVSKSSSGEGTTADSVDSKQIESTLDLNGHSITAEKEDALRVIGNIKLTITDSSTDKKGVIETKAKTNNNKAHTNIIKVDNGAELHIEGGNYIGVAQGINVGGMGSDEDSNTSGKLYISGGTVKTVEGSICVFGSSKVEISGGEFTATDNGVIMTNGSAVMKNCKYDITISGGTFNGNITSNGYIACGIYMANSGDVKITDGTFNVDGGVGILVRSGHLYADGGDIKLTNTKNITSGKVGDSTVVIKSDSQIVVNPTDGYKGWKPEVESNKANFAVKDIKGEDYKPTES